MSAPSTKQKLLSLLEDVEIVSKELFEIITPPKHQRKDGINIDRFIELLLAKDQEIQNLLKVAKQQVSTQKKIDALKLEVDKKNVEIVQLQNCLLEAESRLSTAIYQAKAKLASVNQANKRKISAEELIKYAHKISASNAVAAPPTWAPGDPRRPYPTDIDMRRGCLSNVSNLPPPAGQQQPSGLQTSTIPVEITPPSGRQIDLSSGMPGTNHLTGSQWQHNSVDMPNRAAASSLSSMAPSHIDSKSAAVKDSILDDEVEIMSSDSSSSSSSDE